MQLQPGPAAGGSRWLIVGQWALDSETMATTDLSPGGDAIWAVWCADGLHAAVLQATKGPDGLRKQQICIRNVESGRQTASLDCYDKPRAGYALSIALGNYCRHHPAMYVSGSAEAVLVSESAQVVSLCRLPSLEKVAALVRPEVAGVPGEILSMGWAAQGSLIAIAWQFADVMLAITAPLGLRWELASHPSSPATCLQRMALLQ